MKRPTPLPNVSFVGLGYVGLSTAVCFASRGFKVIGVDVDKRKLNRIRAGRAPFREKGLDPLLRRVLKNRNLTLASSVGKIRGPGVIFITVGTPSKEDGSIDTSFVESSAKEIGRKLAKTRGYSVVVVKSTVVPGTSSGQVLRILSRESRKEAGDDFGLAVNPEFLHEGAAIEETFHPDALLVGGYDKKSTKAVLEAYRGFFRRLPPTIRTSASSAEMMKYAINTGRATQLSFVNTIANICSKVPGCDFEDVRKGLEIVAKMDRRYLGAGVGFGGSCIGKDSRAIVAFARSNGVDTRIISSALAVNERQAARIIEIAEDLVGTMSGRRVSILGLAFKPETNDVRESVSILLAEYLLAKRAVVRAYDPAANENARVILGDRIEYASSVVECIKGTDCCFIATGWKEFRRLRPGVFKSHMASPVILDGRRIYDQAPFRKEGIRIATIGTGPPFEVRKWQFHLPAVLPPPPLVD